MDEATRRSTLADQQDKWACHDSKESTLGAPTPLSPTAIEDLGLILGGDA